MNNSEFLQFIKDGSKDPKSVAEIPWLFRYPNQALHEWRIKIKSVVDHYTNRSAQAKNELRKVELLKSTTVRLNILADAYQKSANEFSEILNKLHFKNMQSSNALPFENVFFEKTPRQQTVMAYHDTFFRDWVWGENEISKQAEHLLPLLKDVHKILVLGAGACGLPLHLHRALSPQLTLAVDINPVLFLQVASLLSGEKIRTIEYPAIARDLKSVAIEHEILNSRLEPNFKLLFADAQNFETEQGSFDTVLTPWFIDIVPRPFQELVRHINQHLGLGGRWVNIGQMAFSKNELTEVLTSNEIRETLENHGFKILKFEMVELPYLHSPYSTMKRIDQILIFAVEKIKNAKKPARYEYLPSWLRDLNEPIPQLSEIQNLRTKTDIFNHALRLIDGQKSFEQFATQFAQNNNLDINSTKEALHMFLVNIYEQLIFREF